MLDKYIKKKQQKWEKVTARGQNMSVKLKDIKDVKMRTFLPIKCCKIGKFFKKLIKNI